jgi:hypothetical protein
MKKGSITRPRKTGNPKGAQVHPMLVPTTDKYNRVRLQRQFENRLEAVQDWPSHVPAMLLLQPCA